ncbi:hypothetical protein ACTXT7_005165 [Hymenolepis weldensis]
MDVIVLDLQFQSKDAVENAMSESLNKLRFLFESEDFASVDKALNEVAGLISIRLKDEYRHICSEMYNSISNIITSEFSKVSYSMETLIHQLECLRELSKQYEISLAKRESVIEVLKSEIDQMKMKVERDVSKERNETEKFCNQLAYAHARRTLLLRMWRAWKMGMESSWKQRAHQRFVKESQQICFQLSQEYEIKIVELKDKLRAAEQRCAQAEMSQARIQESMKTALMRGVCALNMETMTVLQPENELKSSEEPLNISIPASPGRTVVGLPVKGATTALNCLPNSLLTPRRQSDSRVKFSTFEPVKVITTRYNDSRDDSALNTLFRTRIFEYGNPVGPSLYSSVNLGKIRVQRHDSINQVSMIPREKQNDLRESVKRFTLRNKSKK